MEKKMENEMETLGPFKGVYRDITAIMENQMEKKMENEMEAGVIWRLYRDRSIQIIPTLGPKVCKYDLHWAIWIPREMDRSHTNLALSPPRAFILQYPPHSIQKPSLTRLQTSL